MIPPLKILPSRILPGTVDFKHMKTYQNNQLEVNPFRVVPVVGCHFPGTVSGLLEEDTSGVRNPNAMQAYINSLQ